MSRPVSCLGDSHTCVSCPNRPPVGVIQFVSSVRSFFGGKPVVLSGDVGICKLPTVHTASQTRAYAEGRLLCRLGDTNSCSGLIIGPGASTSFLGD
jgi:uncharacterized Zn-binding protein involved in type VI secretion